jgi:hypothetical protein
MNTVVICTSCQGVNCPQCGGKGYFEAISQTTGTKTLHQCLGNGNFMSEPMGHIYPEPAYAQFYPHIQSGPVLTHEQTFKTVFTYEDFVKTIEGNLDFFKRYVNEKTI